MKISVSILYLAVCIKRSPFSAELLCFVDTHTETGMTVKLSTLGNAVEMSSLEGSVHVSDLGLAVIH